MVACISIYYANKLLNLVTEFHLFHHNYIIDIIFPIKNVQNSLAKIKHILIEYLNFMKSFWPVI